MLHLCTYGCLLRPLQVDRGHRKRRVRLRTATWVNFTATRYRIRNSLLPRSSRTTIHTKTQRTLTSRVSVHRSSLLSTTMGVGPRGPTPSSSEECVAVSGRTYEPGGHRQPAEHPRPARTARPHCCRPSAAVPSSPEPELVLEPGPGRPSEPGQEPGQAAAEPEQPSAAAEPEQPSAA